MFNALTLHDVSTARMASTKWVGSVVFSISSTVGKAASFRIRADPNRLPASQRLKESVSYAYKSLKQWLQDKNQEVEEVKDNEEEEEKEAWLK